MSIDLYELHCQVVANNKMTHYYKQHAYVKRQQYLITKTSTSRHLWLLKRFIKFNIQCVKDKVLDITYLWDTLEGSLMHVHTVCCPFLFRSNNAFTAINDRIFPLEGTCLSLQTLWPGDLQGWMSTCTSFSLSPAKHKHVGYNHHYCIM